MRYPAVASETKRVLVRSAILSGVLILIAVIGAGYLESTIPRHIVLASGLPDGTSHEYAQRYRAILAREGVTVEERLTGGAAENVRLLLDPSSGVDVAFSLGGIVSEPGRGNLVMLASLYFEPLWIFYRAPEALTQIDELRQKRIAVGSPDTGVRAFADPLLAANNITASNTRLVPLVNLEAIRALRGGEVDAAFLIGPVQSPAVWQALKDPSLKLMHLERADAYPRRFSYISRLTLPPGTVDFALRVPDREVPLIASKAMLIARDNLSPVIIQLLLDAARELHTRQGYFEAPREFPNVNPVDLPVSIEAERHFRFGPSLLHRYLPFFVAVYVERLIVLLVPLMVVLVPLFNVLPQLVRWSVRSRIFRWYGELALLEREIRSRRGDRPVDQWLEDLDRIERAVVRMRVPRSYASDAYTLRVHIALVRKSVPGYDFTNFGKYQGGSGNNMSDDTPCSPSPSGIGPPHNAAR